MTDQERPWFKLYPDHLKPRLDYPSISLPKALDGSASKWGGKTAIRYLGSRLTFRSLNEYADRCGALLTSLGQTAGSRIAIQLPNIPQFPICYYGILKMGGTVVACSPLYKEMELEFQIRDSGAETIVCLGDSVAGTNHFEAVDRIRNRTGLKHVITTSVVDFLPPLKRILAPLKKVRKLRPPGTTDLMAGMSHLRPSRFDSPSPESPALLQYTGGTTGRAKGAVLTHRNLLANAVQVSSWLPVRESDVHLSVLPFFHIYGMTVAMNVPILTGTPMVLLPRFQPEEVLKTIQQSAVTVFCGVPAMYNALVNHPSLGKYDLRTVRSCISGAAALPEAVTRKFNESSSANLAEGYGLTEASPVTHCNPLDSRSKVRVGSIGIPLPDTDARIVDIETGTKILPRGEAGELVVSGPQVMQGYWNRAEETAGALRDGWLHTDDIATMDEEGYFYIVDRKKDMINVSGFKVWPREVEEVLFTHPGIMDAAVVGVKDERSGEAVKAYVVLRKDRPEGVSEKDIIDYCREKLASYKAPRSVEFRGELPKTLVGKVLRRALREDRDKSSNV